MKKHLSIPSLDSKYINYFSLFSFLETLKIGSSIHSIVHITVKYKFISM